ncbi:GPI-anchored cell wall beta-1,3-endoglucanase EglC [Pyrenophora tritici-repentis]|uniref:Exo-beta-1,3-glucanase n=1 Tax=Pyrenophora tritici-repentis TaxID=45151 RepID=A0A2W1HKK4_9PLEO|nr:GPI-anchored cell wall beta-1-3-endoglucanase EglC [Pyrenophora tritici-repentis]KAF7579458.1 Exo-beta-1,3-glucanase [Pyrenophora tritici-repentis]KAG9378375.1 GPI-anchored cell wall beta-1,3-endoglucanase EglC [Pyrenophora tritici-repentis]KAI1507736.1 GPI-anchored cell wall beta-1,3-endoglucanase EglC [Pyrenophora tritici-repentis]KAI1665152.1 GPI-anchored cell wall beta-1,3-endoglucanase EglC [Pyrenophora tritici-repentis]
MRFSTALAFAAAAIGSALAQDPIMGFNSGSTDDKGNAKTQDDFEKEFRTAKGLQGAPGNFTTIRLYTNIQQGSDNEPIAAFPAAIATNTKLLLGIWASGTNNIDGELKALSAAVKQYGTKLTDLIVGCSVGSEDLYRNSVDGVKAKAGVGNSAELIVKFIKDTRQALANTPLKDVKITHVDTWTAWVNSSNKAVIDELDFLSVNAFPFYEEEHDNTIDNAGKLLSSAISAVEGVAGGKDVWLTETGWAYSGPDFGKAKSTVDNAAKYWTDVGCSLFGKRNTFWYTLRDANPANKVKFAITDNLSTTPRFNLSCPAKKDLPNPETITNGNITSARNTTSNGGSNSTGGSSSSGGNGGSPANGGPTPTGTMPPQSTGAGAVNSVSVSMLLSVIFAAAAWAL